MVQPEAIENGHLIHVAAGQRQVATRSQHGPAPFLDRVHQLPRYVSASTPPDRGSSHERRYLEASAAFRFLAWPFKWTAGGPVVR